MNSVYLCVIENNVNEELFKMLISLLPSLLQDRVLLLKQNIDRKLRLYSYLLLDRIVKKNQDFKEYNLEFKFNEYGKPYLSNNSRLFFNISHTKTAIFLGISNSDIGVDIEKIRPHNVKTAYRFFCNAEKEYIGNDNTKFFEIWTKKEAYLKYYGCGLTVPLNSFNVLKDREMYDNFITPKNLTFSTFNVNDYIATIYSDNIYTENDLTILTEVQLIEFILN